MTCTLLFVVTESSSLSKNLLVVGGEETSLGGKFWVAKFLGGEVTGNHPSVSHCQYTTVDNIYYLKISIEDFDVMEVLESQYNFSRIKP